MAGTNPWDLGIAAVGGIAGALEGEDKPPRTAYDLRPARRNLIDQGNYLLGFSPSFTPYIRGAEGQPGSFGRTITPWGPAGGGSNDVQGLLTMLRQRAPQLFGQLPASQGGPIQRGATGAQPFSGSWANSQAGYGMQPGGWFSTQLDQGRPNNEMLARTESIYGPLGTPTTALQRQSLGGISQFLASDPYGQSRSALEQILGGQGYNEANQAYRDVGNANYFGNAQNAFGNAAGAFQNLGNQNLFGDAQGVFNRLEGYNPFQPAQGALEGMFAQNPGQGMLEALRPQFERNMAAANQQGGRFGSANAILRSRALDDYNLLGAQALQRGIDQQIAAAGQYGNFGNSLINARNMAGQGLLGVGQGQLSQGLGVGQGLLGAGQGQLGVGQGQLSQGLGSAGGLAQLAMALQGDQLNAAGQLSTNQQRMFDNLQGGYATGATQAQQEAERQKQALEIQRWMTEMMGGTALAGRG